jgi:hypothetical protein
VRSISTRTRQGKVGIQLEYNLARGRGSFIRWSDAPRGLYELIYSVVDRNRAKVVKSVGAGRGDLTVKAAELRIKSRNNIILTKVTVLSLMTWNFVRTRKVAASRGL